MNDRKRPPSYSDSYYILNGDPLVPLDVSLPMPPIAVKQPVEPWSFSLVRFTLKGSLHLLFISSFESIFYFLYVSVSEDAGIFSIINAYYQPLLQSCSSWSNTSRTILKDIIVLGINKTSVDLEGANAAEKRSMSNGTLKTMSLIYSSIFLAVTVCMIAIIKIRRIPLKWRNVLAEHISFVVLLGLYEYFFYRTIIYKYTTISTPELNTYIVDGIYQCL
jgi:hypothetical protein